jgi:O-antigen ligase
MEYPNRFMTQAVTANQTRVTDRYERVGFPVFTLGLLITSYFYCLSIGRLASLGTDFRIYDFAFAFFFITVGLREWPRLRKLQKDHSSFHYWAWFLIILVWLSLITTTVTGGLTQLMPAVVRSIRFTSYFVAAGFIVVLVDSPRRYRFILNIIYINIVVQAILAFAQALGWLGSFWPSFYGDLPVGTLSFHHKQIGVVMLLGIALTLSFIRTSKSPISISILLVLLGIMFAVPIFSESRTAWLGFGALTLGYLYIHRIRAIGLIILVITGMLVLFWMTKDLVQNPLTDSVNTVFIDRYERFGYMGIIGERMNVYDNFPQAIQRSPWILIIGTGFENVITFIRATGAHNNYAQAWFELGILGFIVYMALLFAVLKNLRQAANKAISPLEITFAQDAWAAFFAVLATMLVGETLWAQYSMYSLTGQIMTYMALAVSPLYWATQQGKEGMRI